MSDHRYQTLGARFVAGIIDSIVVLPFFLVLTFVRMPSMVAWFVETLMVVVSLSYFVILHGRDGQTIGKKVMKVRVVGADTETRISYRQSLQRESPLIAINLIYFIVEVVLFASESGRESALLVAVYVAIQRLPNYWWIADAVTALFNPKRRSIHDFIGGTVVVNEGSAT